MDEGRHRVVIVGAGFGGLFAAKALRRAPVEVTVIDRANHHLFQPLLYQVATGILSPGEVAPATREVLRRQTNATVALGEVVGVDLAHRFVEAEVDGRRYLTPYDSLIVAAGSVTSYFGHDELSAFAPGLKTIDDALELRGRILGAFELAELEPDAGRRAALMTFVVVGGGPTGVEMAGQIAELSRRTLRGNFRRIDPASARVLLLDGGHAILGSFGHHLSERAVKELRRLGVEIHLGAQVRSVDAQGVDVDSQDPALHRIDAATTVWGAGVQGAPVGQIVADAAGIDLDRHGRLAVQPDCSLAGFPEVYVVGDLMALDDLPGVCEVAMQSGRHAAEGATRRATGRPPAGPFRYRDLGSLASVSRFRAVAELGPVRLSGLSAWLLWAFVHLVFLTGFKNRLGALAHWAVSFLGRQRSERTTTRQQVVGRRAVDALAAEHPSANG